MLVEPLAQIGACKLGLLLDIYHENVRRGELIGRVLLLALLADDQQRSLAAVEALVLKRFLNELGLSALEKAREQKNGNLFNLTQYRTTP